MADPGDSSSPNSDHPRAYAIDLFFQRPGAPAAPLTGKAARVAAAAAAAAANADKAKAKAAAVAAAKPVLAQPVEDPEAPLVVSEFINCGDGWIDPARVKQCQADQLMYSQKNPQGDPGVSKPGGPAAAEKFYITTAINYTNGNPHIGHAYEVRQAVRQSISQWIGDQYLKPNVWTDHPPLRHLPF